MPFAPINPSLEKAKKEIRFHADYFIGLMKHGAEMQILDTRVRSIGNRMYRMTLRLINEGWFSTATSIGRETQSVRPITVHLKTSKDQMIYSGQPWVEVDFIRERGGINTISWDVQGPRGSTVVLTAEGYSVGAVKEVVELR